MGLREKLLKNSAVGFVAAALLSSSVLVSCGGKVVSDNSARHESPLTVSFALTTPAGMSPLAPALESANSLVVGAFAKVNPSAPVVAMGASGTTRVEPNAKLNELWGRGPVNLRDSVTINGWLYAKTLTLGNNVVVDPAKINRNPVFDPVSRLAWSVTFPTGTPQDVVLPAPQKASIVPGYYGKVELNSTNTTGAEITLQSGTYYINQLTLNSKTKVWLDQTNGPVIIYAAQVVGFRATFAALDGAPPDLFFGYTGTNSLFVEANYKGAIVAPNATVVIRSVGSPHVGFFAGKNVELDANAIVTYATPNPVVSAAGPDENTCRKLIGFRPGLTGVAKLQQYASDIARYCGLCRSTLDSDLDLVKDCVDGCPYDPDKTEPGIAGCGVSDESTDPDKVPDGIEECDEDGRNIAAGDCGCVGQDSRKPAGTRCFDPVCPGQTNPTCDGNGVCGATNCKPQGDCFPIVFRGHAYHFCGGAVPPGTGPAVPRPQSPANTSCTSKGMILARVDTYEQNDRLQSLLRSFNIAEAWVGGNSIAVTNAWRWAKLNTVSGDQFWSGGANGSRVNGRFAFWALGRPGTNRCMAMQSSDGRWIDRACTTALPFICENPPVPDTGTGGGSGSGDPPIFEQPTPLSTNCVPEFGGPAPLPPEGELDQLLTEHAQTFSDVFEGSASSPPASGTCPSDGAENCPLVNIQPLLCADGVTECDCAGENAQRFPNQPDICTETFGADYMCRATKIDPTCQALDPSDPDCPTRAVCGVPDCSATEPQYPERCDQIDICPNGTDEFTFIEPDPTSDLGGVVLDPDDFFPDPPSTGQSPGYVDEPIPGRTGKNHVWCQLDPQDPSKVTPANTDMNKSGTSGGSSPVKVSFTPDLIFSAEPNPLSFGQSNFGLNARASMSARVDLAASVLAPSGAGVEVFSAGIGISADRCRVRTNETQLRVFEQNISLDAYVPIFDTDELAATKTYGIQCKRAVGDFIVKADRMKKAFRDAQQLIKQYELLKSGNKVFDANFCKDLGIESLGSKNFPLAGFCPENETPEQTINRFIDYYQRDKLGEIEGLREAVTFLSNASTGLRGAIITALGLDDGYNIPIPFADFKRSESKTIVKTPFAIGPVPMLLEIGVVAGYGVTGAFNMGLHFPTDLDHSIGDLSNPNAPDPAEIAGVNATVEPWASAGMTVFVGVNFGIGSIGIEGALTLAKISAPINAGVGLALATVEDTRIIPTDISSAAAYIGNTPQYVFGPPKAFQFYLTFQYGASINLADVLAGEVNGRLRINFWLFSRTWRKRIVKFNGWSDQFPLIDPAGATTYVPVVGSGTGTNTTAANDNGMGRAESPLPFVFLKKLFVPVEGTGGPTTNSSDFPAGGSGGSGGGGSGGGGAGGAPTPTAVSKGAVEQFSYDTLCCSKQGETCTLTGRPGCCEPLECTGATDTTSGTCEPKPLACADQGEQCGFDPTLGVNITCCSGDTCPKSGVCPVLECGEYLDDCNPYQPNCCEGLACTNTEIGFVCYTSAPECIGEGDSCDPDDDDCCVGSSCFPVEGGGVCVGEPG
jgi:hypothetical protein